MMATRGLRFEPESNQGAHLGHKAILRPAEFEKENTELATAYAQLELRRRLLEVVAQISTSIARSKELSATLLEGLKSIGEAGRFSRCLLLQRQFGSVLENVGRYEVVAEWCAPGVRSHHDCGTGTIGSEDAADFIHKLRHGETFWCRIDDVDEPLRSVLARMEIRATGCAPIVVDNDLWGTLAFDDCVRDNPWDAAHIDALTAVANAISNALQTQHHAEQLAVERAEAAQERAAELAKSNAALRRSISKLADVPDVEAAMVEAISTAAEVIDSFGGALGLYLPAERGFRTILQVINGKRVDLEGLSFHNRLYSLDEEPVRLAWEQFHCGDGLLWCPPDSCYLSEDSRRLIVQQGFSSSMLVALKRGPECIGYLGFFSHRNEDLSIGQRELLRAIADQISLMLELSRLARLSESAAVARERDIATRNRAEELTKANESLRRSVEQLSVDKSLPSILNSFLCEAVRTIGADGGAVMLKVPEEPFAFSAAAVFDGELLTRAQIQQHPYLGRFTEFSANNPGEMYSRLALGESVTVSVASLAESFSEAYDYHRARGDESVWMVPLCLRRDVLGFFGIALQEGREPTQSQRETITALAQQLVLAAEITRLAEVSKQAAIAQEREAAAQERAAELDRANQALRKGIAGLGQLEDLGLFLGEMLKAAVATVGAQSGGINLIDSSAETWRVYPLLRAHGDLESSDSQFTKTQPMTPGIRAIFDEIDRSTTAWITAPEERMGPLYVQFHQNEGNRTIAHIPMRVGSRLIGLLGLGFAASQMEFGNEFSLLRSLADQMTLAVEMMRLSDEAKSAAVAREQEQAAQQRVAELESVNHLLRESAQALARARTPDEICELFLLQAVKAMNGTAGGLLEVVRGTEHRFVALVQGKEVVPKQVWEQLPIVTRNGEITRQDEKGIMSRLLHGEDVWFPVDDDFAAWAPESAEYHRERGNAAIAMWPFHVGRKVKGNVGIAFSHTNPLTDSQRETLKALSSQASLTLELNAMTTEVETAAVAREREAASQARAVELVRANEQLGLRDRLLTSSAKALEELISANDFSTGVRHALRQIGESAELSRVQVLMETKLPNGELVHELVHEWWGATLVSQKTMGYVFFPNADFQEVVDRLHRGERWWAKTDHWPPALQPTLRELAIAWTGVVPIFVQQQYAGLVAFDQCASDRDWSEAEIDALTIAAQGIGAALSQERMATELVNERERAAQDKAAELVKANHALRSSVDDLVTQTTTDGILTSLLKQAVNISGASSGSILRRIVGSEFE